MNWVQVGAGVGTLAAVTAAGAGVGAIVNRKCAPSDTLTQALTCGPRAGAAMGGAAAFLLGGIVGGLLVAALAPKYKVAGFSAAAATGGVVVLGLLSKPGC